MRHFFKSNSWLEPSFDLILYEPFGEIENHHINRQRMQRHFPSPFSLFTNEYNLEPKLNKKSVHNHLPQVSDDGKSMSVKFNLPDHVDPNKINVVTRDGNLIVNVEEKIENEHSTTQYSYYQRCTLPKNIDFESMKAFVDDVGKEVSIQASLKEKLPQPREIQIQNENSTN